MKNTGLKRHPGLVPFAQKHGSGLVCAQRLRKSVRGTKRERMELAGQLREVCLEELDCAVEDERRLLLPFIARTGLAHRFHQLHFRLRDLTTLIRRLDPCEDPGLGLTSMFSNALDEYVRWEEHVLFPALEAMLSDEDLVCAGRTVAGTGHQSKVLCAIDQ